MNPKYLISITRIEPSTRFSFPCHVVLSLDSLVNLSDVRLLKIILNEDGCFVRTFKLRVSGCTQLDGSATAQHFFCFFLLNDSANRSKANMLASKTYSLTRSLAHSFHFMCMNCIIAAASAFPNRFKLNSMPHNFHFAHFIVANRLDISEVWNIQTLFQPTKQYKKNRLNSSLFAQQLVIGVTWNAFSAFVFQPNTDVKKTRRLLLCGACYRYQFWLLVFWMVKN